MKSVKTVLHMAKKELKEFWGVQKRIMVSDIHSNTEKPGWKWRSTYLCMHESEKAGIYEAKIQVKRDIKCVCFCCKSIKNRNRTDWQKNSPWKLNELCLQSELSIDAPILSLIISTFSLFSYSIHYPFKNKTS